MLCSSLTYSQGPPEVLQGDPPGGSTRVYRPPFDEFEVLRVEVPAGQSEIVTAKHVRIIAVLEHSHSMQLTAWSIQHGNTCWGGKTTVHW